jgi:hypothetical protein
VLVGVLTVGLLCDGAMRSLPIVAVPAPAPSLADVGPGVVLEMPVLGVYEDAEALYRSAAHRRKLINGYSGYEPRFYAAVKYGLLAEDGAVLDELLIRTPLVVLIDRTRDPEGRWTRFIDRVPGARPLGVSGSFERRLLPHRVREGDPPALGCCPLAIPRVTADVNGDRAALVADNDMRTGWGTAGPQKRGDAIVADLGATRTVSSIELHQGPWPADVPHALEIALSEDGQLWTTAWAGSTAAEVMRAETRDSTVAVLRFTFAAGRGRFVRLRQTSDDGAFSAWNLAELRVLGSE